MASHLCHRYTGTAARRHGRRRHHLSAIVGVSGRRVGSTGIVAPAADLFRQTIRLSQCTQVRTKFRLLLVRKRKTERKPKASHAVPFYSEIYTYQIRSNHGLPKLPPNKNDENIKE